MPGTLKLHSASEAVTLPEDDMLVPASADGDTVAVPSGFVMLRIRNDLRRKTRTVTVTVLGDDYPVEVRPRTSYVLGPFGLEMGPLGLEAAGDRPVTRLDLVYDDSRGLRVAAIIPPADVKRVTWPSPPSPGVATG
jgi:hypothetical protein